MKGFKEGKQFFTGDIDGLPIPAGAKYLVQDKGGKIYAYASTPVVSPVNEEWFTICFFPAEFLDSGGPFSCVSTGAPENENWRDAIIDLSIEDECPEPSESVTAQKPWPDNISGAENFSTSLSALDIPAWARYLAQSKLGMITAFEYFPAMKGSVNGGRWSKSGAGRSATVMSSMSAGCNDIWYKTLIDLYPDTKTEPTKTPEPPKGPEAFNVDLDNYSDAGFLCVTQDQNGTIRGWNEETPVRGDDRWTLQNGRHGILKSSHPDHHNDNWYNAIAKWSDVDECYIPLDSSDDEPLEAGMADDEPLDEGLLKPEDMEAKPLHKVGDRVEVALPGMILWQGAEVVGHHRSATIVCLDEMTGSPYQPVQAHEIRTERRFITVNGINVPEPMAHEPETGSGVYAACCMEDGSGYYARPIVWAEGDILYKKWLRDGLIHATLDDASIHGRAMNSYST